jgi:hypothetical protein
MSGGVSMQLTLLLRMLFVLQGVVVAGCLPTIFPFDVEENPLTTERVLIHTVAIAIATMNLDDANMRAIMRILFGSFSSVAA